MHRGCLAVQRGRFPVRGWRFAVREGRFAVHPGRASAPDLPPAPRTSRCAPIRGRRWPGQAPSCTANLGIWRSRAGPSVRTAPDPAEKGGLRCGARVPRAPSIPAALCSCRARRCKSVASWPMPLTRDLLLGRFGMAASLHVPQQRRAPGPAPPTSIPARQTSLAAPETSFPPAGRACTTLVACPSLAGRRFR